MENEKVEWSTDVEEPLLDEFDPGNKLLTFSLLLALGTSVVSIVLFLCNVQAEWTLSNLSGARVVQKGFNSQTAGTLDPGLLDRPNAYIGLDKLPLDIQRSTLPEALDVFPVLFQPVDNGVEDYVFPDDEHARFTFNGRVSPGDKRVLLKNDVCCLFVDKYCVLNY